MGEAVAGGGSQAALSPGCICVTQLMLYTGDKLSSPIFCCPSVNLSSIILTFKFAIFLLLSL